MLCPDTIHDCDNPGCRHGGCQGRRPEPPLLRALQMAARAPSPVIDNQLAHAAATDGLLTTLPRG